MGVRLSKTNSVYRSPLPYTPAHLHRQPDTATDDENIVSKVFVLSKNISCKGYQKKKIWIARTLTAP